MIIKKYIQFIEESSGHQFGVVMIEIPVNNWDEIVSHIDPDDVYTEGEKYGIEDNPHCTILYGLHKEVSVEMVEEVLSSVNSGIDIEIEGIGIFNNHPKFDVVKFNIKPNNKLQYLFDELSKLPNSNEYPDYCPHITISYVKKGTAKKYINNDYRYGVSGSHVVTYSTADRNKVKFDLNEKINEATIGGKTKIEDIIIGKEPLDIFLKYFKKHDIQSSEQLKKECDEKIEIVKDIWNEINYEFPHRFSIKFQEYGYRDKLNNIGILNSWSNISRRRSPRITPFIDVSLIDHNLPKIDKELSLFIIESLDRCKDIGVSLSENVDVRYDRIFRLDVLNEYRYYKFYSTPEDSNVIKTIEVTLWNKDQKKLRELYKILQDDLCGSALYHDNIRKEMIQMGYGIRTTNCIAPNVKTCEMDIRFNLFKLKKRNEDNNI
jgi:hypothetical protein